MWVDAKATYRKYQYSREARQKPGFVPANANKRLASRFYIPAKDRSLSHRPICTPSGRRAGLPLSAGGSRAGPRRGSISLNLLVMEALVENPAGEGAERSGGGSIASRSGTSSWTSGAARRSWLPLFHGRGQRIPDAAEEDARSEASEWVLREREGRDGREC